VLHEVVEAAATTALASSRPADRQRLHRKLREELDRSGLAGYVTPFVAVGRRGRGVRIRARERLWFHLAFRSDPLEGRPLRRDPA